MVQVHLSRLWTDTRVQKQSLTNERKCKCACHFCGQPHNNNSKRGVKSVKLWVLVNCDPKRASSKFNQGVQVHLSLLWTDTQVRKSEATETVDSRLNRTTKRKPQEKEVRVHLSRLWTDTQVQSNLMKSGESTSAPVTSVDRHTSTKKDSE